MCTTNMDFIDVLISTIVAMLKLLKFTQTPNNAVVYFFNTSWLVSNPVACTVCLKVHLFWASVLPGRRRPPTS